MEQKLALPRDFKELIVLFLSREVRFHIVGAYALGIHGPHKDLADLETLPET